MKRFLLLATTLLLINVAQAQSPSKRVIALSDVNLDSTVTDYDDSITYQYAGSRGNGPLSPELDDVEVTGYDVLHAYSVANDTVDGYYKEVITYNGEGNISSQTFFDYNSGVWVNDYRTTYAYSAGDKVQEIYEEWQGGWDTTSRNIYTYDGNHNKLSTISETYSSGNWQGNFQILNTYDAANNLLSATTQLPNSGSWLNSTRQMYTYNTAGKKTLWQGEYFTSGLWEAQFRETYTYNAQNSLLSSVHETRQSGNWLNDSRNTYTYDASENRLSHLYQTWQSGAWANGTRNTYSYTAFNKLLSNTHETWNTNAWEYQWRNTKGYDGSNRLITANQDLWGGNGWQYAYSYTYPYDAEGYWLGEQTYNIDNGDTVMTNEVRLYYETYTPNGVAEIAPISSSVYPNPASQNTMLTFETTQSGQVDFSLFDINGQQLQSGTQYYPAGKNTLLLDMKNLAAGMYVYHLRNVDGNTGQGKIVKH